MTEHLQNCKAMCYFAYDHRSERKNCFTYDHESKVKNLLLKLNVNFEKGRLKFLSEHTLFFKFVMKTDENSKFYKRLLTHQLKFKSIFLLSKR